MRLTLFLSLISLCSSYKYLVYAPQFAASHINFLARITDVLIDAGHEVVVLSPVVVSGMRNGAGTKKARVIEIPQTEDAKKIERIVNVAVAKNSWTQDSLFSIMKGASGIFTLFAKQCDIIFHMVGIEKFAITESLSIHDSAYVYTHIPTVLSYVPSLSATSSDVMSFKERLINSVRFFFSTSFIRYVYWIGDSILSKDRPNLPPIQEIMANNSLVFFNCEPLVDFPKLTSARVIDIGGITVSSAPGPLNKTWSDIMDLRPKTVLISFGSMALAYQMSDEYKNTIRNTIKAFPNVTFVWKYEKPEHNISEGIDNLIESTWFPQREMLYDERLSAFITHGGQGSITEAIDAGVPLVVIPIRADQSRNGRMIERNGLGIIMDKTDLSNEEHLTKSIKEILENESYRLKAKKVQKMVRERPFSMKDIFVRNMEFLVEHGPLRQLDHYGRYLNFFQYYLIDVVAFVSFIILAVLFVVIFSLKWIVRRLIRVVRSKPKTE